MYFAKRSIEEVIVNETASPLEGARNHVRGGYRSFRRDNRVRWEGDSAVITTQLPDISTFTTVDAIAFYTRQVSDTLGIRPGTPGRAERLAALLDWKRALHERIERERAERGTAL